MIKYKLICKNCDLLFDSWFASSDEFEKLKKRSFLTCHLCNSKKIEKSLMAPKMINKLKSKQNDQNNMKFKKIRKKIKEYQNFIEKNFENVGANFAYEARSIHYKDKKKDKGIYGTASKEEISELKEEGINAELIPWLEDKNN
tara:strand:- start:645 stop:1073 length:429 start_codon:yes stop_codon:yes gene_type:complete